jgi:hypothetical protein
MKRLTHLFQVPKTRMKAVVFLMLIVLLATAFFVIRENQNQRETYLQVYRTQQTEYTEQLANQLEQWIKDGKTEKELVSGLEEICEVSANSWSFLCKDNTVLFAKDDSTTQNLRKEKKKSAFMATLESQDAVLTKITRKSGAENYIIGTITDENYALSSGGIIQHEIYLYLIWVFFAMLTVMTIIALTSKLNEEQRKLEKTADILQKQNVKLEHASEEATLSHPEEREVTISLKNQNFYDADLIRMFLSKSDDAALMPMHILFIDLIMEDRYYSRTEIFSAVGELRPFFGEKHVTGEIQKGRFVVLMYRTSEEEAKEILEKCRTTAESGKKETDIRLNLYLVEVKEGKSALRTYEEAVVGKK